LVLVLAWFLVFGRVKVVDFHCSCRDCRTAACCTHYASAPGPQSPVAGGGTFPHTRPLTAMKIREQQRQQKIIPQIVSIVAQVQDFWLSGQESETQAQTGSQNASSINIHICIYISPSSAT